MYIIHYMIYINVISLYTHTYVYIYRFRAMNVEIIPKFDIKLSGPGNDKTNSSAHINFWLHFSSCVFVYRVHVHKEIQIFYNIILCIYSIMYCICTLIYKDIRLK